ncbi:MAG: Npt1/Npt2 family nucleotide transporter [Myxococcota bacterium]
MTAEDEAPGRAVRATGVAAAGAFTMIAGQVGSKATRDAVFLSAFGADKLPVAMLISSVLSVAGVLAMSRGLARMGPRRLVPLLHGLGGVFFALEHAFIDAMPRAVSGAIYLHVAVLGSLFVSGFWSLVSELFDPHGAKRAIARISAAATMGGLVGGLVAERVSAWFDARAMLLVLALLGFATGVSLFGMSRRGMPPASSGQQREAAPPPSVLRGMGTMGQARYLRMLGLLVLLTAVTSGLLDYAFKAEADAAFDTREELLSFFGLFYTVAGVLTFLLQAGVSRVALDRLGVGGTIAVLPALVAVGAAVATATTRLASVLVARAVESIVANTLFRSGYELLFTPLPPETKRPTKTFIDVGFDRLGGALASGVVLAVLATVPALAPRLSVGLAAASAGVSLLVAFWLHRGYVAALAASLRTGRLKLDAADVVDATTRRTLAETTMAIDRVDLLRQIEALRTSRGDGPSGADAPPPPAAISVGTPAQRERIEALLRGTPTEVRHALRPPLDLALVGWVVPLLGDQVMRRPARRALRQAASRCVGQLLDAVVDPEIDVAIRAQLPPLIATVPSARATRGLFEALADPAAEVRRAALGALDDLMGRHPEFALSRAEVFDAVGRGLDDGDVSLPSRFDMLALVLDREPLQLALDALRAPDPQLRGTGLEYLDNVLPEGLRTRLLSHLERYAERPVSRPGVGPSRRTAPELADELRRSTDRLSRGSIS